MKTETNKALFGQEIQPIGPIDRLLGKLSDATQTGKRTSNEPAQLLDVADVAAILGVSGRHVYRLADAGRIPRPVKLGGSVRWSRTAILDWIAAGCPAVDSRKRGSMVAESDTAQRKIDSFGAGKSDRGQLADSTDSLPNDKGPKQ